MEPVTANALPAPVKTGVTPSANTGAGGDGGGSSNDVKVQKKLNLNGSKSVGSFLKRGDLALAFAVIAIIVVLILPMPSWLLDILLALSFIVSVMVLMTALFIEKPLEFSSFPTVLLITAMLRLSLNLASTRLILANGHEGTDAAGSVIQAFGNFVMGGNFVIGVIVFAILVIVNFVVITKGSGRIAEVAARFALDAMPGKQMAIDADLAAGMIDEKTARERRSTLENEASFYGAMDGASKFVRGDAIAGLLITFINVIGGIIIGMAQMDLSASEAASTYTLLTVGDGLVTQIPSLIVSIAAGLLVSKAGVTGAADQALSEQFTNYPKALWLSSFLMILMAILPGIPVLPFTILGAIAAFGAYLVDQRNKKVEEEEARKKAVESAKSISSEPKEEPISSALKIDDIKIEVGYGLVSLMKGATSSGGERLPEQIKALRRQLATELGFVMPSVRIVDNAVQENNTYIIKIKEVRAASGQVYPDRLMAMDGQGRPIPFEGVKAIEPAFGLDVVWINPNDQEDAQIRGLTVVDATTVVATHLTEVVRAHMSDLLSYGDVQELLNTLPSEQQKLVEELVPNKVSITTIQSILHYLLKERVSIRDLGGILEGVAEATEFTRNPKMIVEHVRMRLSRQICASAKGADDKLPLISLSSEWEEEFIKALHGEGEERHLAMAPSKLHEFIQLVQQSFEEAAANGDLPALMVAPVLRPHVRSLIERFRPQTIVLSQAEIHPQAKLKTVGMI